jgi:hypothetical protein
MAAPDPAITQGVGLVSALLAVANSLYTFFTHGKNSARLIALEEQFETVRELPERFAGLEGNVHARLAALEKTTTEIRTDVREILFAVGRKRAARIDDHLHGHKEPT